MKLSASNIGWDFAQSNEVYALMQKKGFKGLEIVPTKFFPSQPYTHLADGAALAEVLKREYGFSISSMQSIWYGKTENIFDLNDNRELLCYTMQAIDFAKAVGCKNLVFGCPKNRNMPIGAKPQDSIGFFKKLGDYAYEKGTVLSLEANPAIYGTNFINDTAGAVDFINLVNSKGFKLNLDFGTIAENSESLETVKNNLSIINHVHISEPFLAAVQKRKEHAVLAEILRQGGYKGYVSLEIKQHSVDEFEKQLDYIKEVFG